MPRLPTEEEVAWMMENIDDTLVPDIIACAVACGALSIVILALRFYSRIWLLNQGMALADWLILIAWVFFAVFDACFGMIVLWGGGRHIILVTDPADARMLGIINIVNEIIYSWAMGFVKFSILAMFGSIFPQRGFRWCLWAVAAFMAGWVIVGTVVSAVQCDPVEFNWDVTIPGGSCINFGLFATLQGVWNVITDFVILIMPIPLVLKLKLSSQKKALVILTFALGGSACIVSIVRLNYSLVVGSTPNGSWDMMPAGMLSVVELMVGMLCASFPAYRPLYRRWVRGTALGSNSRTRDYNYNGGSGYARDQTQRSTKITAANGIGSDPAGNGGINVTDDIDMVMHIRKNGEWVRVYDEDEARLFPPQKSKSVDAGSRDDDLSNSP